MGILRVDQATEVAHMAVMAGADMIQLRDKRPLSPEVLKSAVALRKLARKNNVLFIVNDRADVAVAAHSDGLHIGQSDISASLARGLIGSDMLLGISATNIKEAVLAKQQGADYVGAGPVFKTPIKNGRKARGAGLLRKLKKLGIPFFAIGGINSANIRKLAQEGFHRFAVIRAICGSADPFNATKMLKKACL